MSPQFEEQCLALVKWLESQGAQQVVLPHRLADDGECPAYRWKRAQFGSVLIPIPELPSIKLSDLLGIDAQKQAVVANTQNLLAGKPANNVLLTGARGTGKSSLLRALLHEFYAQGLRVIEVDKDSLIDWHPLMQAIQARLLHAKIYSESPQPRYILYCDDLSFDEGEHGYKALKSILDGGFAALPTEVCVYASSNRRHLLPEYQQDNLSYRHVDEEIHPGEVIEEKISLSERFGLWLSFYPLDQETYWHICAHWLQARGVVPNEAARAEALRWALTRSARNGRIAEQFARAYP